MATDLNPYEIKVAVSTGARKKGRLNFCAGSVKLLKNQWKAMGVQIVRRSHAEYVVVPDGTQAIGRIQAIPIFYSEFINMLQKYPRPPQAQPPRVTGSLRPSEDRVELLVIEAPEFDTRFIEQELEQGEPKIERLEFRARAKPRDQPSTPAPVSLLVEQPLELTATTAPLEIQHPWQTPTIPFDQAMQWMSEIRKPGWQNFLTEVMDDSRRFYPSTYESRVSLLRDMVNVLFSTLQYWSELRVNAEMILLPPERIAIDEEDPCRLPLTSEQQLGYLEQPNYWMSSAWVHYREHWNEENQNILGHTDLLANLNDVAQAHLKKYFWQIETDLYLIYASMQCGMGYLDRAFEKWARVMRSRFAQFNHTQSCASVAADQCNGLCLFKDDKCRTKPMLFALEDVVTAYCGSTKLLPTSAVDQKMLLVLWNFLQRIYVAWFGQLPATFSPDFSDPSPAACKQIRYMNSVIMTTLKKELGLDAKQEVLWSDLPLILNLSEANWDRLWSRQKAEREPAIQALKQAVFSEDYQHMLRDVVASLSTARVEFKGL